MPKANNRQGLVLVNLEETLISELDSHFVLFTYHICKPLSVLVCVTYRYTVYSQKFPANLFSNQFTLRFRLKKIVTIWNKFGSLLALLFEARMNVLEKLISVGYKF